MIFSYCGSYSGNLSN